MAEYTDLNNGITTKETGLKQTGGELPSGRAAALDLLKPTPSPSHAEKSWAAIVSEVKKLTPLQRFSMLSRLSTKSPDGKIIIEESENHTMEMSLKRISDKNGAINVELSVDTIPKNGVPATETFSNVARRGRLPSGCLRFAADGKVTTQSGNAPSGSERTSFESLLAILQNGREVVQLWNSSLRGESKSDSPVVKFKQDSSSITLKLGKNGEFEASLQDSQGQDSLVLKASVDLSSGSGLAKDLSPTSAGKIKAMSIEDTTEVVRNWLRLAESARTKK